MDKDPLSGVQRRVAGHHDFRMDGMTDLVLRARGMSVLDVGCNKGMVGYEFACNGARLVHGCDVWEPGINVAREVFADIRSCSSQFEVVDLSRGPAGFKVFGDGVYDVVLLLAVVHKIQRQMSEQLLGELLGYLADHAHYFIAAASVHQDSLDIMGKVFDVKFERAQTSTLSEFGTSVIWRRVRPLIA